MSDEENAPPEVRVLKPVTGTVASVGAEAVVRIEARFYKVTQTPEGEKRELLREDELPAALNTYRMPTKYLKLAGLYSGKALNSRRTGHGEVTFGKPTVTVSAPRGAQLVLGQPADCKLRAEDFDENGAVLPSALLNVIQRVTGPEVGVNAHLAFAKAFKDAVAEKREPDGRFWVEYSEFARILGHTEVSEGVNKKTGKPLPARINNRARRRVRENFLAFASHKISEHFTGPDGKRKKIVGELIYPTKLEEHEAAQSSGKGGKKLREQWQIRPELWQMLKLGFVETPIELLNALGELPKFHAETIRVYDIVLGYARLNPMRDEWELSWEYLVTEANCSSDPGRPTEARRRVAEHLDRLVGRGVLTQWHETELKKGSGVAFALTEQFMGAIRAVRARRARYLGRPPKRRRLKQGTKTAPTQPSVTTSTAENG